jgi:phospholipid/cholesterol/gamma-HCH transport system substrate-binding protein
MRGRWYRVMRLPALLVATTLLAGACEIAGVGSPPSYQIRAEAPSTIGLYPGSFVRQLGINVGSVSKVTDAGDHVEITLKIKNSARLAGNARVILVADSVLGERYVQFEPAYTGGPALPAGTVLPESRVTVPVETDTVLRSLNTVLHGIDPKNVTQFTTNLAAILQGNGQKLNQLIGNAAGTVGLLADKSQDLGQLTATLAELSTQLGTRDQALANLITDYDLLSQSLAGDRSQLNGVITQLTNVTTQATSLLAPNLGPIKTDVADLTTVGQTLDRNIKAVDIGLQYAPRLFGAAQKAYDPEHNWLPLNPQSSPGLTSAVLAGDVRDALASVCRRLAAKNPALAPALNTCGDPGSSVFNPVLGLIPTIVDQLPGQSPTTPTQAHTAAASLEVPATRPLDATSAFAAGLAAIPGLTPAERQALLAQPAAGSPGASVGPPGGPPGAAAVAALTAQPRGSSPAAEDGPVGQVGPAPVLRMAASHHRGMWARLTHWVGGLL